MKSHCIRLALYLGELLQTIRAAKRPAVQQRDELPGLEWHQLAQVHRFSERGHDCDHPVVRCKLQLRAHGRRPTHDAREPSIEH